MKRFKFVFFAVLLFSAVTGFTQPKSTIETEYPQPMGHLRFTQQQIGFNNIFNTEIRSDTVRIYNEWNQVLNIEPTDVPEYLKVIVIPKQLKPQQKGIVINTYDAGKRNDWGFVGDRVNLRTNDSVQPDKSIGMSANIVEDFSKMTPAQLAKAAKIKFDTLTYDFGTVKEGDKVETKFVFKNLGDSLLRIRKVKGS
jgi:hypothetical protein